MTLESTINKNRYIGNGATKVFPFTFKVWKEKEVAVFTGDGLVESDVSTQCKIDITATGGTVTFLTPPKSGVVIVIRRSMPYIQEDNYINGTRFDSEEVEDRFDQDCAERQDLRLDIGRAIKIPLTSSMSADELVQYLLEAIQALREAGDVSGLSLVKATGSTEYRALADRFADVVNVKDYGAKGDGETDDSAAIESACNAAREGQFVFFPPGEYVITRQISCIPVILYGSGEGSTTLHITFSSASTDAFVFSNPTDYGVACGAENMDICLHSDARSFVNSTAFEYWPKNPSQRYRNLKFYSDPLDSAVENEAFAQKYSWSACLNLGDAYRLEIDKVYALGRFLASQDPSGQDLDTFIQFNPDGAIMHCYVSNLLTHNIAIAIKLLKNTYFNLTNVDIARSYEGVDGGSDSTQAYYYGESVWTNVAINSIKTCVHLKTRLGLVVNGMYMQRTSSAYTTGISWKGLDLDGPVISQFSNIYVADAAYSSGNGGIGINLQGSKACNFSNVCVYSVDTLFNLGTSSSKYERGGCISNVEIMSTVGTVIKANETRNYVFSNLSVNNNGGSYSTLISFGNEMSAFSSRVSNFGDSFAHAKGNGYFVVVDSTAGTDEKKTFVVPTGLTTATDGDALGNNFLIAERSGLNIRKLELRSHANDGYILLSPGGDSINCAGNVIPTSANAFSCGSAGTPWSHVYSHDGTIEVSDARVKTGVSDPSEAVYRAWGKVGFKIFQFIDAVEKKGVDAARLHVGVIAQEVQEAFASEGLDAGRFGLFCHDEWESQPAEYDEDGALARPAVEAGDRFGIRYEEALALECAYQRWCLNRIVQRVDQLTSQQNN